VTLKSDGKGMNLLIVEMFALTPISPPIMYFKHIFPSANKVKQIMRNRRRLVM